MHNASASIKRYGSSYCDWEFLMKNKGNIKKKDELVKVAHMHTCTLHCTFCMHSARCIWHMQFAWKPVKWCTDFESASIVFDPMQLFVQICPLLAVNSNRIDLSFLTARACKSIWLKMYTIKSNQIFNSFSVCYLNNWNFGQLQKICSMTNVHHYKLTVNLPWARPCWFNIAASCSQTRW